MIDRATWWTEIFETPCIAVAHTAEEIAPLLATDAEFLGLESTLWIGEGADVAGIQAQVAAAREANS